MAVVGYAEERIFIDPTSGFSGLYPPYVRVGDSYRVAPAYEWTDLVKKRFLVVKPDTEVRVFFLGGSSTRGHVTNKMETQVSAPFPARAEEILNRRTPPGVQVRCINMGMAGYGSTREVVVTKWVARHGSPDAVVIYVGHNEVPELRFRLGYFRDNWRYRLRTIFWRWRLYHLAADLRREVRRTPWSEGEERIRPKTTEEDRAFLGLDAAEAPIVPSATRVEGPSDEELSRDVAEQSLRKIAEILAKRDVPLLVVPEIPDLAHTAPQVSFHGTGVSEIEARRVEALLRETEARISKDSAGAEFLAREAVRIDPDYAAAWWWLGRSLRLQGRRSEARAAYWEACDRDRFAFRATRPILDRIRSVARAAPNARLVEVSSLFYPPMDTISETAYFAAGLLSDHVHPTQKGHDLIAEAVAEELTRMIPMFRSGLVVSPGRSTPGCVPDTD